MKIFVTFSFFGIAIDEAKSITMDCYHFLTLSTNQLSNLLGPIQSSVYPEELIIARLMDVFDDCILFTRC
jgi:hypothetical protein